MDEELRGRIRRWKQANEAVNAAVLEERCGRSSSERLARALALVAQRGALGRPLRSPAEPTAEQLRWVRLRERLGARD